MRNSNSRPAFARSAFLCCACLAPLAGCDEGYTVPAHGADLRAFGSQDGSLDLAATNGPDAGGSHAPATPQASFPAIIAAVRVQDSTYGPYGAGTNCIRMGGFNVVTTRDVEIDQNLEKLAAKPMIKGIVPLNRLSLTGSSHGGERSLMDAARTLEADMLLIYTLDSTAEVDHHLPELSFLTLGLAPEGEARSNCTASAVLLDARSGYIYAVCEGSDQSKRLATFWSSGSARIKATRASERSAFKALLANLGKQWENVVKEYAKTS